MECKMQDLIGGVRNAYNLLEDDESKKVFIERLCWIVTGDYGYVRKTINRVLPGITPREENAIDNMLKELPQDADIIMYGFGEWGRKVFSQFIKDGRLKGICDKNSGVRKKIPEGMRYISPGELISNYHGEYIVITTNKYVQEISDKLKNMGIPEEKIFNIEKAVLKTTGDTYFVPDIVNLGEEIFIDAGCKNLDTSIKLASLCNLKKVYAFEPDEENNKVCVSRVEKLPNCEVKVLPYGTWNESATLKFNATNDGCSHITEKGNSSIEVRRIDDIIPDNETVTFIKMDVEGAELNSLKGAVNTIKRCHPKLAICIYHKPEDMVELQLFIHSISSDYKFYIRHHSNYWNETVLYAL